MDFLQQRRATIYEARVELNQTGAFDETVDHAVRVHEAAHADDGKYRAEPAAQPSQDLERFLFQRRAADTATLAGAQLRLEARQTGARIGGGHAVDPAFSQHLAEAVHVRRLEVRGYLHQQWHLPAVPGLEQ